MSKKPCPILYFILLYKLSQDFLGRLYIQVHSVYCVCVNWSKYNEHPLIVKHYNTVYPRSLAPFYILSQDFLDRQYIQVLGVPYSVSNKYTVFSTVCPGSSDPPENIFIIFASENEVYTIY